VIGAPLKATAQELNPSVSPVNVGPPAYRIVLTDPLQASLQEALDVLLVEMWTEIKAWLKG
jgi:hypothetical protein